MSDKKRQFPLDEVALLIIGTGAAVFYYYFEKNMAAGQNLAVFITMGIILLIRVRRDISLCSVSSMLAV